MGISGKSVHSFYHFLSGKKHQFIAGLLSDLRKDSAVNVKDMTIDRIRGIRCQEYCRTL